MNYTLVIVFSFSIVIGSLIGLIRFKKIDSTFYPFIFCLWIGLLNELISFLRTQNGHTTAINNNIYVLIESLLITWQFKNWGLLHRPRFLFQILFVLFISSWTFENFFVFKITYIGSYFRVLYSFVIVLMSVNGINDLIIRDKKDILRNPVFLICIGFIFYYTYKVLVETFWIYGLNYSRGFRNNVYFILTYVNLFANLIYALAVLWMPMKQRFTLPS